MTPRRLLQTLGASLVALVVCSCEEYPPYAPGMYPRAAPAGWWNDEGTSGSPKIVVHIGEQKAYFYKSKHLVGETTVSTGKPGFSTPPGHYTVISKDIDHVSTIVCDVLQGRLRDAPRVCSALCRIPWLHSPAEGHGKTVFRTRSRRNPGNRHRVKPMVPAAHALRTCITRNGFCARIIQRHEGKHYRRSTHHGGAIEH